MFKLGHFAFGALAIGTLALSATASAAPLPLFPFIMTAADPAARIVAAAADAGRPR